MRANTARIISAFFKAAARAAVVAIVLMSAINGMLMNTGLGNPIEAFIGAAIGMVAVAICIALVAAIALMVRNLRPGTLLPFLGVFLALAFLLANPPATLMRTVLDHASWKLPTSLPHSLSLTALTLLVAAAACAAGLLAIVRAGTLGHRKRSLRVWLPVFSLLVILIGSAIVFDLARDGADPYPATYRLPRNDMSTAAADDPSLPGSYVTEYLSYGAGNNYRRVEFGADRDLTSRTVDASPLLPEWKGLKQSMRERYWDFGLDKAPLNGLLWAPQGDGPFPLVLIVHGNHGMEDYSDAGYAYLGELLASRGFLTVSVDQNFINGSWSGDFQGKEMAARAWLLLQHLQLWRDWNEDPQHSFFDRVDMQRIALIGHSRGGEAVSIAHAFNSLSHFPDDATVAFDFGFNIRALVAIAQVDQRYHRRVELQDVNFFTIHGSYDSDEPAYHGLRQINRISFDGDRYLFKAGVYLHGANHGQFNSSWGRSDYSPPGSWLLNLAPIIPAEQQRQAASVYIAAFLEASLHDDGRYLELMKDPRTGSTWLPDLAYVQQFTDSTFRPLADFEEDIDVRTATAGQATISAEALPLWREEELEHRDQRKQGTSVVVLGWNADSEDRAAYSIMLNGEAAAAFTASRALSLSVSGSTETPPEVQDSDADDNDSDYEATSPAFRVELVDAAGNVASALSSEHASLAPPMKVRYLKNSALNDKRYNATWEPVLQHLQLPMAVFSAANPQLDLSRNSRDQVPL